MAKLSVLTWIGNAAAVLFGRHGDVSAQATDAGCSRQAAYDHADQVEQAVADARLPGPSRQQLLDDNRSLRQQLEQRRAQHQAERRVDLGKDKQRQLATTAWAMGLSLGQIKDLLGLLLPAGKAPGRSTLGRWVLAAARRAGPVLRVLDAACAPRAQVLCPDEIFFHGRPVLVAVEPTSMALLLCQKAKDRQGPTWQQALRPFTHLEAVVRDAGTGLSAGLALLDQQRRATRGLAPLEDGLDLFHTEQEAQRLLGRQWRYVEDQWAAAEEADRQVAQAKARGRDARGPAARARAAWERAFAAFRWYERRAAVWRQVRAALRLFRPDGALNDRAWAAAQLQGAVGQLQGASWRKVRSFLQDPRTLTFLDRTARQLAEAEPRPALREALVQWWRLQRRAAAEKEAALPAVQALVQRVVCAKLCADGPGVYGRVSEVLSGVVRASSAVECVNSVLRMQQARHRTMTQPMLDLKRLYWNCRRFRGGRRRDRCPYQHLGLALPTYDFWELLHSHPDELAQQLSSSSLAA
jgi:hypothetical protein